MTGTGDDAPQAQPQRRAATRLRGTGRRTTSALFQLQRNGPAEIAVTGEIDAANADSFAQSVIDMCHDQPVVVDLSRLVYLDSAGFAALDHVLAAGAVVVVSPDSLIHRAAELMNLPFHPDVDTARRTLGHAGDAPEPDERP
jgi:anti-sigma B factor antagonist